MQQLLRYGIVCSVALMLVLPPNISSAQSQQLQEILDSAAEALDTAEAIASYIGEPAPP